MARRVTNLDVRAYATSKGIRLGDIAVHMGINQSKLSTAYFTFELPAEQKEKLYKAIDEIADKRERGKK